MFIFIDYFKLLGFILSIASTIFVFYSEGFTFNLKFLGNFCVTTSAIGASILQVFTGFFCYLVETI